MRQYGIDYRMIEAKGILMPVIGVQCDYKRAATYGELVAVHACPTFFNGARLRYRYEARDADSGAVLVTGGSEHCFIDAGTRKPLNLKRRMPEYCEILIKRMEENGVKK